MSEIGCLKRCGDPSEISGLGEFSDEPQLQEIGKIWSEIMAIPAGADIWAGCLECK